jgi:putative hydrolase of the HAD superfamily
MAEEAYAEFQRLRNQVTLYDDVLPALAELRSGRLLVALTNGNADLDVIGLSGHFDAIFTAAQVGAAKPDPRVYRAVCEALDLVAEQVIHAGDDPERDVVAARAFGMPAVWINRAGRRWPDAHPAPEHEVADLLGLAALLRP